MLGWRTAVVGVACVAMAARGLAGDGVREVALTDLSPLEAHAKVAEIVGAGEGASLRLDGLVLLREFEAENVGVEVEILVEAPCYPGIAFRALGTDDFELAYVVPHASGQWDAVQYDPVFNGSNTWQLYHGPAYQATAAVPTGEWVRVRLDAIGDRAAITVDDQPPLVVERLAHGARVGRVGLWTYRPARFRNLKVGPPRGIPERGVAPVALPGAVTSWYGPGGEVLSAEPGGVVNLNRWFSASLGEVLVTARFVQDVDGVVEIAAGASDRLALELDGATLLETASGFSGFSSRASRGYAEAGAAVARTLLAAGEHELIARVAVNEPFGWGFVVTLGGSGVRALDAVECIDAPAGP